MTKGLIPNLAHKASVMMRRMEDLHKLGNKGILPTVFTYNGESCGLEASCRVLRIQ